MRLFNPNPILISVAFLMACAGSGVNDYQGPHAAQEVEFGGRRAFSEPVKVKTGLDALIEMNFAPLVGKRVGVVSNHTAVSREGVHLVDLLHSAEGVELAAIFAPEHGFRGVSEGGESISTSIDSSTGAPIYSLYGETRRPTAYMFAGLDIIVFDIQDVGARFYTYISTMGHVLDAGGEYGVPVMILDRPNPIGGMSKGPILDMEFKSFVGMFPIPIQHGLTVAELAKMIQGEEWVPNAAAVTLHVVPMEGWNRDLYWSDLDLEWIDPSPNMRNVTEALTYPGLCLLEGTNLSEGRGTILPFEQIGAPWIDGAKVARKLLKTGLKGFTVEPVRYIPESMPGYSLHPKFEGQTVNGILIRVTEPWEFDAIRFGLHFIAIVHNTYSTEFEWSSQGRIDRLWGSSTLRESLASGMSVAEIVAGYEQDLKNFRELRTRYLIYTD